MTILDPGHLTEPPATQTTPQPLAVYTPPTNNLALLSLITSTIGFGLVGIILGHIALAQLRARREQGRTLAIVGLVLGYAQIGFLLLGLLLSLVLPLVLIAASGLILGLGQG